MFDGNYWTWISGSNYENQNGIYGSKGISNNLNIPGARSGASNWIDSDNNFWIFGGLGYAVNGTVGNLNDLWMFDGNYWTWISGSNSVDQNGIYGSKGISNNVNIPGSRHYASNWIDSNNIVWLFGGIGYDNSGSLDFLNDLWKFDGTDWTWISGSNSVDQNGIYGEKGISNIANIPGSRNFASNWIDSNNNLWLFGGVGYPSSGTTNFLNDLWKFGISEYSIDSNSSSKLNLIIILPVISGILFSVLVVVIIFILIRRRRNIQFVQNNSVNVQCKPSNQEIENKDYIISYGMNLEK